MAYTSGTFWQGFGAFFDPIVAHFGWSRAITSAAVSIQRTESGMISPFVGYFIDRFGPRNVMLAGIFVTGWGFIFLSQIHSLWQFYLAFVVITIGLSFGSFLVTVTTVANWFVSLRGRALGMMSAGSALGGLLVPVVVWIATPDWRQGLLYVGIGFWLTGIPAALVMRSRPEDYGLLPDGKRPRRENATAAGLLPEAGEAGAEVGRESHFTVREALKTRAFWQMATAIGAGQLIMSASIHQIPAITWFGFSRGTAGYVMMAVAMVSIIGRIGSGVLGDTTDKRWVMAVGFAFQLVGTVLFAYTGTIWHLVGFIVFWGIGLGASIPIRFALLADYFGRRHFGSIMGTMMTVTTAFGVVGPIFVGWMFDVKESYRDPFLIISITLLAAIPLILTVRKPTQRRDRPAQS